MSAIFCDSSGLYAVVDPLDAHHQAASQIWRSLRSQRARLTTTNYVFAETTALLQRRLGMTKLRSFVDAVSSAVDLHFIDSALHELALNELLSANRRHLSFVDCSSFAFMRRARIKTYFGFDDDFKERGFTPYVLPLSPS